MTLKPILPIVIIVLALIGISLLISFLQEPPQNSPAAALIEIATEHAAYTPGDHLRVKIHNNSGQSVCFSSCYPYYLEHQNGAWEGYEYQVCEASDYAEWCLESNNTKAFKLTLPPVRGGVHRLAVPICKNCSTDAAFQPEEWHYSNEFTVNR